jgi:hypothetical protein
VKLVALMEDRRLEDGRSGYHCLEREWAAQCYPMLGVVGLVGSRDNATDSGNAANMTLQNIIKTEAVRRLYAENNMAGSNKKCV